VAITLQASLLQRW